VARVSGVRWLLAALIVATAILAGAAQSAEVGTVIGSVVDTQGIIPGATVRLVSQTAGSSTIGPVITDRNGSFAFPNVPVGTYTITVQFAGYQDVTRKGIDVHAGDRVLLPQLLLLPKGIAEFLGAPLSKEPAFAPPALANAPAIPGDHAAWVLQVLARIQTIKPGMTRADLLKVFTTEGGIFTREQRTYVSRDCKYFKVDVKFEAFSYVDLIGVDPSTYVPMGLDVIREISRPYIQMPAMG